MVLKPVCMLEEWGKQSCCFKNSFIQSLKTKILEVLSSDNSNQEIKRRNKINFFPVILGSGEGSTSSFLIVLYPLLIIQSLTNIKYWKLCKHATSTEILTTLHWESSLNKYQLSERIPHIFSLHRCLSQLFDQLRVNKMY